MTEMVGMQSPWVTYAKEVEALFDGDPDVIVLYEDADGPALRLCVSGEDKAEGISQILPDEVTYGGVTMPIEVVPDNEGDLSVADHLRRAFAGNPALEDVVEVPVLPGGPSMCYALFAPEVVQVECDDASSPYGLRTTTYEAVARDVLSAEGVMLSSEAL